MNGKRLMEMSNQTIQRKEQMSSSYCKVTYSVTRGTKSGYIKTRTILTKTSGSTYSARGKVTTYRRPSVISAGQFF
jgi:hypothetical protein